MSELKTENQNRGLTAGAGEVEKAADSVLEMFLRMLDTDAEQTGGALSAERARLVAQALRDNREVMAPIYEKAAQACVHVYEEGVWEDKRANCMARLLVHGFEHLISEDLSLPPGRPELSRACIPGFIEIMIMVMGQESYDSCYERARRIVDELKRETGKVSVWDELFASSKAQALVREALMALMGQFEDYEKRRAWFIDVMNSHLDHQQGSEPAGERWHFEEQHFKSLMQALYSSVPGLADQVEDGPGRAQLAAFLARIEAVPA